MIDDFGIIIACCEKDYIFAKGCCASIKYFLGDIPICLIVDGDFSTESLETAYKVKVIKQKNVSSDLLKSRSFGHGLTKMVAFWESPWENFLYLDADTVVWFDILKFANFDDFDVIIDKPTYPRPDRDISSYFFDIEEMEKEFPEFKWQNHRNHYFCTGAFFAKRDIFHIDEYMHILDLIYKNPKLFYMGEQGFLNFLFCRAADEGRIRLGQESIQVLVPDFEENILSQRFPVIQNQPIYKNEDVIVHWCGANKPSLGNSKTYSEPMTFCRQMFLNDVYGSFNLASKTKLYIEDANYLYLKYKYKISKKISSN